MTRRSQFQRVALLAASTTVITGGVLLPGGAFAATQAPRPSTVTAMDTSGVDPVAQWTDTTDAPSGITVQLPGKAQMKKATEDGVDYRLYQAKADYGFLGFAVYDAPADDTHWDLKALLQNFLDGYNEDSRSADDVLTSTRTETGTTADGHPMLNAELAADDGTVCHTRFIDLGGHLLQLISIGVGEDKQTVEEDYQQLLDGVRLPDSGTAQSS